MIMLPASDGCVNKQKLSEWISEVYKQIDKEKDEYYSNAEITAYLQPRN